MWFYFRTLNMIVNAGERDRRYDFVAEIFRCPLLMSKQSLSIGHGYHSIWARTAVRIYLSSCICYRQSANKTKMAERKKNYTLRERNERINYSETRRSSTTVSLKKHNFQRDPANNTILIRYDYLPSNRQSGTTQEVKMKTQSK